MNRQAAHRFSHTSELDVPVENLWDFHMAPEALPTLSPPLSGFKVIDAGDGVANGSVLVAAVGFRPFRRRWVAIHSDVEAPDGFTDTALESPFPFWVHRHAFSPVGSGRSRLTDTVWFVPPTWLPRRVGGVLVGGVLRVMFWWRHRATRRALARSGSAENNVQKGSGAAGRPAHCAG